MMPSTESEISQSRPSGSASIRIACCSAALFFALSGCKSAPTPPNDDSLAQTVRSQLTSDASLNGQPIQANVGNGVATLTGAVSNDAQRTIAARDAAGVSGIREVVNNLTVATLPPANATLIAPTPQVPAPPNSGPMRRSASMRSEPRYAPQQTTNNGRPQQPTGQPLGQQQVFNQPPVQQTPVAPAQPAFRNLTVAPGTTLPVRITQTLDSETAQQGQSFSGTVASDVVVDGLVAIPAGSPVAGRVDAVQEAGHFSGASLLTVSLVSVSHRGERTAVSSEPYTVQGKGRGRNTAEKAGGGAAVGAILGGIFGGGKGAAIGAAAGGGAGAGANAITRGQQVQIPSESVVRFRIDSPISVRVRTDGAASENIQRNNQNNQPDPNGPPVLQRRPNL